MTINRVVAHHCCRRRYPASLSYLRYMCSEPVDSFHRGFGEVVGKSERNRGILGEVRGGIG